MERIKFSQSIDNYRTDFSTVDYERLVTIECPECNAQYMIQVGDLIEITLDGYIPCECGTNIRIPYTIRYIYLF